MNLERDVVILIPTKRPPPLLTLESMALPPNIAAFVLADPSVYQEHRAYYRKRKHRIPNLDVLKGKSGLVPQIRFCYSLAQQMEYSYFFRLDDDCPKNFFVRRDRSTPTLTSVIQWAMKCAKTQKVSLVGFANSSRVDWLGHGMSRSYGLIHGAAQLVRAMSPNRVLPAEIVCYEDIYRSCAHRQLDGAVGRVNFVGMNKIGNMKDTVNADGKAQWKHGQQQLLRDFPGFGTFFGVADVNGIPRFRHRPHAGYSKLPPHTK